MNNQKNDGGDMKETNPHNRKEKIKFLTNISILSGLSKDQIEKFADICSWVTFDENMIIMKENEYGDTMYLFVEGEVEFSYRATLDIPKKGFEEPQTIGGKLNAKFVPFFGDMALFDNSPRSATIKTLSHCSCYEVKKDDFDKICREDTEMGYQVLKNMMPVLSRRLRNGNENVMKLTTLLTIVLSKKK